MRGFSLLEVIVALTIAAMVFTVAFHGISVSLETLTRIEESNRRVEFVRSKLAELDLCSAVRPGDHAEGAFADGTRWKVNTSNFVPETETNAASLVGLVRVRREHDRRIVSYQRQLEEAKFELRQLATSDGLTGVKNRRAFRENRPARRLISRRRLRM